MKFEITETQMQLALREAWVQGYVFATSTVEGRANHFIPDLAAKVLDGLKQTKQEVGG